MITTSSKPHVLQGFARRDMTIRRAHARVDQRQFHVLHGGGAGQQVESLEHETDFLIADLSKFVIAHGRGQFPIELVGALRWGVQATNDIHHCGFAGPRRSHDGHVLPAANGKRDAVQRAHFHIAHHINLGDVLEFNQR